MLTYIRNSKLSRILWGIMALHIFNISVDTVDPTPHHVAEDLSFNDQESIVEIFVEQVLGYEDAIKEYDDNDIEANNSKKSQKVQLSTVVFQYPPSFFTLQMDLVEKKFCLEYEAQLLKGFKQISIPPPRV